MCVRLMFVEAIVVSKVRVQEHELRATNSMCWVSMAVKSSQ